MTDPIENQNTLDKMYRPPSSNPTIVTNSNHTAEENYGIVDWFKKCLKNYVNFSGRARRKEYWYFVLAQFVLTLIAMTLDYVVFDSPIVLFYMVVAFGLILPGLAVMVRRLHDTSRSGWWVFISFIPLVGSIILLVFLASDTKPESNQWGAPAR